MSGMDELQALAQSIGEYTVDLIGRDNLDALQVTVDRRNRSAQVSIELKKPSDAEQLRVLDVMFELEQMYFEEVVLSYSFVEAIDATADDRETVRQFSYA